MGTRITHSSNMREMKKFISENRWLTVNGFRTDRDGKMIRTPGIGHDPTNDEWDAFLDSLDTLKLDTVAGRYQSAGSGARLEIFPDDNTALQVINGDGADVFLVEVGGADIGDVTIGDYDTGGNGIKWDESASIMYIKGAITFGSSTNIIASINASAEGINIEADNISIDGTTTFASLYDPTEKSTTVYSASEPTSPAFLVAGNLWVDTDDNNRVYTYTGAAWVATETVIDGGRITTGTIDASLATITNIDADNISTGTLTGRTVQTASSGQRIVIDQATDSLIFYDSGGNPTVWIDGGVAGFMRVDATGSGYAAGVFGGGGTVYGASALIVTNTNTASPNAEVQSWWGYPVDTTLTGVAYLSSSGDLTLGYGGSNGGNLSIAGNMTLIASATVDTIDVSLHAHTGTAGHGVTLDAAAIGSGILPINRGGTGVASFANDDEFIMWDAADSTKLKSSGYKGSSFEAAGGIATHAALQNVHGLNITAGQTLTVTTGGTIGSAAYTATGAYEAAGAVATHDAIADAHHAVFTPAIHAADGHTMTIDGVDVSAHAISQSVHGLAITAGQTLTVTTGGTLGTAAYTATGAYEAAGAIATHAAIAAAHHTKTVSASELTTGSLGLGRIAGTGAADGYYMRWSIDTGAYWAAS